MERRLRDEYLERLEKLAVGLTAENHALAVEIASIPDDIRGYGHVKEKSVARGGEEARRADGEVECRAGAADAGGGVDLLHVY